MRKRNLVTTACGLAVGATALCLVGGRSSGAFQDTPGLTRIQRLPLTVQGVTAFKDGKVEVRLQWLSDDSRFFLENTYSITRQEKGRAVRDVLQASVKPTQTGEMELFSGEKINIGALRSMAAKQVGAPQALAAAKTGELKAQVIGPGPSPTAGPDTLSGSLLTDPAVPPKSSADVFEAMRQQVRSLRSLQKPALTTREIQQRVAASPAIEAYWSRLKSPDPRRLVKRDLPTESDQVAEARKTLLLGSLVNPQIAQGIGVSFTDATAEKGKTYIYSITSNTFPAGPRIRIQPIGTIGPGAQLPRSGQTPAGAKRDTAESARFEGSFEIRVGADPQPPTPTGIKAFQLDERKVIMRWDRLTPEQEKQFGVVSYDIFRTDPEHQFLLKLNQAPIVIGDLIGKDEHVEPAWFFEDTPMPHAFGDATYTVVMRDSFGRTSPPGTTRLTLEDWFTPDQVPYVFAEYGLPDMPGRVSVVWPRTYAVTASGQPAQIRYRIYRLDMEDPEAKPELMTPAPITGLSVSETLPQGSDRLREFIRKAEMPAAAPSPPAPSAPTTPGGLIPVKRPDVWALPYISVRGPMQWLVHVLPEQPQDRKFQYLVTAVFTHNLRDSAMAGSPEVGVPQRACTSRAVALQAGFERPPIEKYGASAVAREKLLDSLRPYHQAFIAASGQVQAMTVVVRQNYEIFFGQMDTLLPALPPSISGLEDVSRAAGQVASLLNAGVDRIEKASRAGQLGVAISVPVQQELGTAYFPLEAALRKLRASYLKIETEYRKLNTAQLPPPIAAHIQMMGGYYNTLNQSAVNAGEALKQCVVSLVSFTEDVKEEFAAVGGQVNLRWEDAARQPGVVAGRPPITWNIYRAGRPLEGQEPLFIQVGSVQDLNSFSELIPVSHANYFTYRVAAVNRWGVEGAPVSVSLRTPATLPPSVPSLASAFPDDGGRVVLKVRPGPAAEEIAAYHVYRKKVAVATIQPAASGGAARAIPEKVDIHYRGVSLLPQGPVASRLGPGFSRFGRVLTESPVALAGDLQRRTAGAPMPGFRQLSPLLSTRRLMDRAALKREVDELLEQGFTPIGQVKTGAPSESGLVSFADDKVEPQVEYVYHVVAENRDALRSSPSAKIEARPYRVSAPKPAAIRFALEQGKLRIAWDPIPDAAGYILLRAEQSGTTFGPDLQLTGIQPQSQYLDSEVRTGRRYRYRVRALDSVGNLSDATERTVSLAASREIQE